MADRTVAVDLIARVGNFVSGMRTAQGATTGLIGTLEKSAAKQAALKSLGNAAGAFGLVGAAAFLGIVKTAANFDQAMSNVQASTGQTGASLDSLRQAALDAGQATVFSATESAGAIESLSKAGVSTADILGGGLTGALNLAAAGQLDVGDAAEIAASAMTQFGLAGGAVPHIADLLAAGAGKAQGTVADLGAALNQTGIVASQTGLSIEETTGGLAAFASAGLTGSDAGTSFKTMLQSLTPRSAQAAAAMKKYGLEAYDTQGNFVGLTEYAGKLRAGLKGLTDQQQAATLKTIFGSDAVRAASVLYKQGADGIASWIDQTDDAGYAAEQAHTRMDNLNGDLENLKGAFETALIGTGDGATGALRTMTQDITKLINAYNSLPGPIKSAVGAMTGIAGVIGLGGFAASKAIGGYIGLKTNLAQLGVTSTQTGSMLGGFTKKALLMRGGALAISAGFATIASAAGDSHQTIGKLSSIASSAAAGFAVGGPWGAALGGAVGVLGAFTGGSQEAAAAQEALAAAGAATAAALNQNTGAMTKSARDMAVNNLATSGAYDAADKLGISYATVTRAALGSHTALAQVNQGFNDARVAASGAGSALAGSAKAGYDMDAAIKTLGGGIGATASQIIDFRKNLDQAKEAQKQLRQETAAKGTAKGMSYFDIGGEVAKQGQLSTSAKETAAALKLEAAAARDVVAAHNALADSLLAAIGGEIGLRNAQRDSLTAAKEAHKANHGRQIDLFDESAASDNLQTSLVNQASAWNQLGPGVQKAGSHYEDARVAFVKSAMAMDVGRTKARAMAKEWLDLPNPKVKVKADTNEADRKVKEFGKHVDNSPKKHNTKMNVDAGDARKDVGGLTRAVKQSPGKHLTEMKVDAGAARNDVGALTRDVKNAPTSHKTKLTVDAGAARNDVGTLTTGISKIPKDSKTTPKVDASGANNDVDGLKRNIGSVPGDVSTTASVSTSSANSALSSLQSHINSMHGTSVTITTYHNDVGGKHADGGYISGPGGPREDKIPAYLSNGEFVVNAGATSRHLSLLHSINANGYKDGGHLSDSEKRQEERDAAKAMREFLNGLKHFDIKGKQTKGETKSELSALYDKLKEVVGKDSPLLKEFSKLGDHLVRVQKRQDGVVKAFDKATDKLKSIEAASRQYAKTVASAFTHDAFGGSAAESILQLKADRNDANEATRDLKAAEQKGLSGRLLKQLAASGNTALIDQVAHMSRKEITQYEHLLRQRNQATAKTGDRTATAVYSRAIEKQTNVVQRLDHRINKLNHVLEHLEHAVEKGAEKGTHSGNAHREARAHARRKAA